MYTQFSLVKEFPLPCVFPTSSFVGAGVPKVVQFVSTPLESVVQFLLGVVLVSVGNTVVSVTLFAGFPVVSDAGIDAASSAFAVGVCVVAGSSVSAVAPPAVSDSGACRAFLMGLRAMRMFLIFISLADRAVVQVSIPVRSVVQVSVEQVSIPVESVVHIFFVQTFTPSVSVAHDSDCFVPLRAEFDIVSHTPLEQVVVLLLLLLLLDVP